MSSGFSHTTEIRVRYAETDAMRFVYHGNYLVYFENARTEMLRAMGLPYSEVEKLGVFIVVIEAHVQYKRPAQYDDVLLIKTTIAEPPTTRLRIEYEITKKDSNEIFVTGYTVHTFMNMATHKPTRPLKEFTESIQKYFQ